VRRTGSGLFLLLLMALALSGCTAANKTGVRLGEDDLPVVVNCGTWIERVNVTDADTGRRAWAAHVVKSPHGGVAGVGTVVIGSLPGRRWFEDSPLALEPRPSTWRFAVDSIERVVLVVPDSEFVVGRVYRPGNKSESVTRFHDQTCSGIPISLGAAVVFSRRQPRTVDRS
jgi:hypothetical protein